MPPGKDDLAALARVVARPTASSLDGVDDARLDAMARLAVRHRVVGSLVVAARDASRELPEDLARANDAVLVNHLRSLVALERAARALDDAGVGWAVVKGPVLAKHWAGAAMARSYDDLDLLVDPRSMRAAIAALRAAGFEHRNRNWAGFRALGVGEVPLDDGSVVLDLHWSLLGLAEHRRAFSLPTRELLERSVAVQLGPVQARTLDAADTLTHIGVHHALAGGRLLVQLMDVLLVARAADPDLARRRLRDAGATRIVMAILDRAVRTFGEEPPLATAADGDRWWIGVNRALDRAWRWARPGAPLPGALVAAGRARGTSTAVALAKNVDVWVRTRVGRATPTSEGGPLDWHHADGDASAYEAYVDDVESGRYGC